MGTLSHTERLGCQSHNLLKKHMEIGKNHFIKFSIYCKPCQNLFLVSSVAYPHNITNILWWGVTPQKCLFQKTVMDLQAMYLW